MQGVTDAVGSSTGGIYFYFPTRDHLAAALQDDAFTVMHASFLQGQRALDEFLEEAGVTDPGDIAMTRALAVPSFWIDSEMTLPNEVELTRRLIAGASRPTATTAGIPTSAMGLLVDGVKRLDDAIEVGVLDPGASVERGVSIVAALTGVLMTSNLGDWDQALFDGPRLAREILGHVFVGWGARHDRLDRARSLLDEFTASHSLAPADVARD